MVQHLNESEGGSFWDGEMDATGSGCCPVAGFGVSGVEPSGSATGKLLGKFGGGLKRLVSFRCRLIWSHFLCLVRLGSYHRIQELS
jgi:hypothetical protein